MLIAINRNFIDKPSEENLRAHHSKFTNRNIDAAAVAKEIKNGHAFCAEHKPGKRSTAGFVAAGFLALDIDHGLTLEAARADSFFGKYATILYATPSHTAEKHRFRIVFELEQPITDAKRMKAALTGLATRFGGDKACTDPCRMFFGSSSSDPEVFDRKLPDTVVDDLVKRGEERVIANGPGGENSLRLSPVHSRINIPRQTIVRTDRGELKLLSDVPVRTRIFCPQHADQRASAVTLRNRSGNPGLYCSACAATYFLDDGRQRASYIFDYGWRSVLSLSYDEYTSNADDDGFVDLEELRGVKVLDQRHLEYREEDHYTLEDRRPQDLLIFDEPTDSPTPERSLVERLTLVKSPKGTGKTEWLGKIVQSQSARGSSVLLIGHRRSLISATAARIGLTCYLSETDSDETVSFTSPTTQYAICLDSLHKIDTQIHRYDMVLIDEVEQVFAHLLSNTLRDVRREALHTLSFYLKNAKAIYALDADLSSVTIELFHAIFGGNPPEVRVLMNEWQPTGRSINLYDQANHHQLLGELVDSLNRGERCFVCSNSKKLIEEIHQGVLQQIGRELKTLCITSENSQKADIQDFILNIKSRALEYDAIFTSPALGTGIDVTFDDNAQHIDSVFGFFRTRINTHFDIDQQLARVRNPKRVCVWVSPEEFNFETDSEAIKAEILASESQHKQFLRIETDGRKIYDEDPLYETVYSTITAAQRASKNHLKKNFIELRESDGWTIEKSEDNSSLKASGRTSAQLGKDARIKAGFERILGARCLTTEEYDSLKCSAKKGTILDEDTFAMRRYEIESFYRKDATIDLLEEDSDRKLREAINRYEFLMTEDAELQRRDLSAEMQLVPDKPHYVLKKKHLSNLLNRASLLKSGVFIEDAVIDASMLGEFSAYCLKEKPTIERLFDLNLRRDVVRDPIKQLKQVLGLFGLSLTKIDRDQSGGRSRTLYQLDADKLNSMRNWVSRRADETLAKQWMNMRNGDAESIGREPVYDPLDK